MQPNKINFQIQYFAFEKKEIFKNWARKNNMSMKDLLEIILENKKEIQKIIVREEKWL